MFDGT
ncbi:hypothetical protein LEMLEM_LOCUS464 [Lemmus lemmus]